MIKHVAAIAWVMVCSDSIQAQCVERFYEVRGTVRESLSDHPVEGANVILFIGQNAVGSKTETRKDGSFAASVPITICPNGTVNSVTAVISGDYHVTQRFTSAIADPGLETAEGRAIVQLTPFSLPRVEVRRAASGLPGPEMVTDSALIRQIKQGPASDDTDLEARAAAIDAAAERRIQKAVPALIDCLNDARRVSTSGKTIADHAAASLKSLTRKNFGLNQAKWRQWYAGGK
jgi:hypothetical protein